MPDLATPFVIHTRVSIAGSVFAGMLCAAAALLGAGERLSFFPETLFVGGVVGLVLSPAAVFARSDAECRASFAWVVAPTAALTFLAAAWWRDMWAGFLVSVATYFTACVIVGLVAMPRRRRLNWYAGGCCSSCGYDVRGLEGPKCPECGEVARVRPRVRVPAGVLRE